MRASAAGAAAATVPAHAASATMRNDRAPTCGLP
jgi:hypothetical protein